MGASPVLTVTGISKTYGHQPALRDVSFQIAAGEIVGLVGPNGAGKSTTMRIICGLLRPDSGHVTIDGIDQREQPARGRARLGAMIEAPACYPTLTAFDHLAYLARIRGCFNREAIERLLTKVGLPARSRKPVRQFSLGMKQRLGLAMAMLDSPALLVLDEPMNGLDPVGMAELRDELRGLAATDRVAILISSHLLHEVEQICHRVLFIRDCRVIKDAQLDDHRSGASFSILLVTGDPEAAVALLLQQPFIHDATIVRDGVSCRLAPDDVPAIAPVLVAAGIPIHAMAPRADSLEDLYLSHYSGAEGQP
jgi:ABC-2 type transport system ATP-binding protein